MQSFQLGREGNIVEKNPTMDMSATGRLSGNVMMEEQQGLGSDFIVQKITGSVFSSDKLANLVCGSSEFEGQVANKDVGVVSGVSEGMGFQESGEVDFSKKKRLLEELQVILLAEEKASLPARNRLGIEVIDETALIQTIPVSIMGNDREKEVANSSKIDKKETDMKKAKRSRRKKVKNAPKILQTSGKDKNLSLRNNGFTKKIYSRMEMEAMRVVNVDEQNRKWKQIYKGLESSVVKEYDDLKSPPNSKNQQQHQLNFNHRQGLLSKQQAPPVLGAAAATKMCWKPVFLR